VGDAAAVVARLRDALAKNPGLAAEVGAVIQLRVTAPDSAWVLRFTGAVGNVEEGSAPATTTLTIEDAELAAWAAGKADARGLFQRGKLRVDGDVGPIHRLGFVGKL